MKEIEAKNEEDSKNVSLTLKRTMARKFNWISDKILCLWLVYSNRIQGSRLSAH